MPTYLFLYSSLESRTALPLVVEEGLGTNHLVGQALVVMTAMHKNHLQRVVVGAKDSLHLTLGKGILHIRYAAKPSFASVLGV